MNAIDELGSLRSNNDIPTKTSSDSLSLNIIGKNIIEFRPSSQNNNNKFDKNSINSDDEIGSKYDDGDNSDKNEEKSDEININKNKENY